MKRCPYCSAQIADDSLFCEVCGKKQPQGRVCSQCGMPINDGDVFCGNCGHKIEEEVKAAPVQKKCPHCGGAVEEDDVFCQTCGKKIDAPRKWPAPSVQEIVRYECKHCGKKMEDDYIACDDYMLCKECWAAEFEELEKEHAEQTQQTEAAEPKVVEEEKNSLKVVVIVLVCVAVLIGGGWWYYYSSVLNKQQHADVPTEVKFTNPVEIEEQASVAEADMIGTPTEADAHSEESIKKRVEEIFAKAYNGEGGFNSELLSTEFCQALIYDAEYYDEIPDNYVPYIEYDLWEQAQDCSNPHITVKSVSKLSKQTASAEILRYCFNNDGRPITIMLVLEDGKWKVDDFIDNTDGYSQKEGLLKWLRENFNYHPTRK